MVPRLPRYYEALRLLAARPATATAVFAARSPSLGGSFLRLALAAWALVSGPPTGKKETTRSPRFLGSPCPHALLSDPGGATAPWSHRYCRVAFRHPDDVGLHEREPFRGSITRPTGSLSTLRSHGHPRPRKTHFRLVTMTLAGRASHPLDSKRRFLFNSSRSPSSRLCLAHPELGPLARSGNAAVVAPPQVFATPPAGLRPSEAA